MQTSVTKRVPFLDLRVADDQQRSALLRAVDTVLRHGRIVLGPEVEEFEHQIAARCNRKFAVGVNSGSDALLLGLLSLGVGPGDEIITTALSWVATANAIALAGATPVFADIGADLNLDPACVERLITSRTKAIMPVHYTGKPCDMAALSHLAEKHGLLLVEDAAQAFGARFDGQPVGSFGTIGCFSMNPMKVLAACGEAGAVVTDREDIYQRLISLRYNGTINREVCVEPSRNSRLDTLQAAILLVRLSELDQVIHHRRDVASWYDDRLAGVVECPQKREREFDVYYTYTIRTDRRDELKAYLESQGIETKIQHPRLMPQQPAYQEHVRGHFPNAERQVQRILCIPAHEKLARSDVDYVADHIQRFIREA